MAYPASALSTAYAFERLNNSAKSLRDGVQALRDLAAVQDVARPRFIGLIGQLSSAVTLWDQLVATPGIATYAQEQLDDPTIDIVAEYTAMRAATLALRDWIYAALPVDATSGAVLEASVDVNGVRTPLYFTVLQLAEFVTTADSYLLTVT